MKYILALGSILLMMLLAACGKEEPSSQGVQAADSVSSQGAQTDGTLSSQGSRTAEKPKAQNSLWDAASPGTSMISFSCFDGKSGYTAYEHEEREQLLAELKATPAKRPDAIPYDRIKYPVYGNWIGTKDGRGLQMIWTNGILITRDGEAYEFDFDWEKLTAREWTQKRELSGLVEIPGAYYLMNQNGQWNFSLMTAAEPEKAPADIEMIIKNHSRESVEVSLKNAGKEVWTYGADYSLKVLNGESWYAVPTIPTENWGFVSIGYELAPQQSADRTYSLAMFGELPAGNYKLNVNGCEAEFELP